MADVEDLMDAANAAREVAMFAALALMATETGEEAVAMCEHCQRLAPAEGDELDAATIAAQAIRDAMAMRSGASDG